MTIGQRIAERRKLLGISQESLGEQMGVSRQAISKWEADGAIPEIDKLIALSKLFGVSVGWLLGTEDECEKTDSGQEVRLSDEQLKMVEQIVRRYQQAQPEQKRNPWTMVLCLSCAIVALVLSIVGLSKIDRQFSNHDYRLGDLINPYSAISAQLNNLSGQLDELAEGEELLSEFGAEFEVLPDWKTVRIEFRAVPKSMLTGDLAYLSLWQNGSEKYWVQCDWNGDGFVAEVDADYGEYDCYFVQCRGTNFQIQNVSDAFSELPQMLEPVCELMDCELNWDAKSGILRLETFGVRVDAPEIIDREWGLEWTKLDLVVMRNGEEVRRLDMRQICEVTVMEGTVGMTVSFGDSLTERRYANKTHLLLERSNPMEFRMLEVQSGDRIVLVVEGVLSNGYSFVKDLRNYAF